MVAIHTLVFFIIKELNFHLSFKDLVILWSYLNVLSFIIEKGHQNIRKLINCS